MNLPNSMDHLIMRDYRPKDDTTAELVPEDAAYYQSLIGVLQWIVELGRVNITTEVSIMSSYMALSRFGHLQQLFNIFAYLKKHHNAEMIFDPSDPAIDMSKFLREKWQHSVYATDDCELKEALPSDMPEARGEGMTMQLYVDNDHAGDVKNRKLRTGFLVYLQSALIYWSSKKQTSVEMSSFGSEFMAIKTATEYV